METHLPDGHGRVIVELDDERLLAPAGDDETPQGSISTDLGKSWSDPFLMKQGDGNLKGRPRSLLKLEDGRLGAVYGVVDDASSPPHQTWFFAISDDDGRTWSAGTALDQPGLRWSEGGCSVQHPWPRLRQLSNGRLVQPVYWAMKGRHPEHDDLVASGTVDGREVHLESHAHRPQMGGSYVYYSDDLGETWERSVGSVMVWPLPGENELGGFEGTYEPVPIELEDGRLLMLLRTRMGRFYRTISEDGGVHWSPAEPTELATGDVPCDVGRLPSTGDLVIIWNQCSEGEIREGYYRSRLSVAISRDEGETWENHKTVDISPGLQSDVGKISPPPKRPLRTRKDVGVLPDGFVRIHYPHLAFVQDHVVMGYSEDRSEWFEQVKLQARPESWFYE